MAMLRALTSNWARPTRIDAPPRRLLVQNLVWFRVMQSDCLAIETHWDRELPVFRRDRVEFRCLLTAGVRAIMRLRSAAPKLQRDWRSSLPWLASVAFWRRYVRHGAPDA